MNELDLLLLSHLALHHRSLTIIDTLSINMTSQLITAYFAN